jgi:hydroxymethylbilane synthase
MDASGDRDRRPGGSPDFTDRLDRAIRTGALDLAVHSAKDLPAEDPADLTIVSCPKREDPRDCLVAGRSAASGLVRGATVGSSSPRRRAQLLRWRPDLEVLEIRGNVDRRLRKVVDGEVDAVVLALAGLRRLGRPDAVTWVLPRREFLPAPAQGALALVARAGDRSVAGLAASIDHPATRSAVAAERGFASGLGSDCRTPLAAAAQVRGGRLTLDGELLSPDGRRRVRARRFGPSARARSIGLRLAASVLDLGGTALLSSHRR